MTPTGWLDLLADGRTYITNGPLLEFTVDGQPLGGVIDLAKPARSARSAGGALGRARLQADRAGAQRPASCAPRRADQRASTLWRS